MNTIFKTMLALAALALTAYGEERTYAQSGDTAGFSYFPEGWWSTGNKTFQPGDDVTFTVGTAGMADIPRYVAVTNAHTTFGALATTNLDVTLEFSDWRTSAGTINFSSSLTDFAGTFWFYRPDVINFAESTVMRRLRASGRPRIDVAAGEKLVVSNLVGRGTIKLESADAELELVRTSGDLAGVHFYGGDLTLHGDTGEADAVDVEKVLAKAMIHLDAQNASSLTLEGGKVKVWNDPVGGGKAVQMKASAGSPYQSYIDIPLPAYVADYNGSGKPVIDFGPYSFTGRTDFATCGTASLKFQKNGAELRDNASHVFIVFADNDDLCQGTPYNDSYNHIYARAWYYDPAARNFNQMRLSKMGALASYGTSARTGRDGAYNGQGVQSMFQFGGKNLKIAEMDYRRTDNTGPTYEKRVGALARRSFEYWGGVVIGEIIVFSDDGGRKVSLTDAERTAVNDYLRKKWLPASEQKKIALNEILYGNGTAVKVVSNGTARIRHVVPQKTGLVKDGPGTLLVGDVAGREDVTFEVRDGAFGFAERSAVSDAAPASGARHHFDADAAADSVESEVIDGVTRVTRWNDEDASHQAATPVTDIQQKTTTAGDPVVLSKPTLVENMLNGRRGISLGRGLQLNEIKAGDFTNASALVYGTLRKPGDTLGHDGDFREGFAVVRFRYGYYYAFGTDTGAQNMHNMGNDAAWAHPDALGASVSWNGLHYDLQAGLASHLNEFGVLRFSCGDAQPINAIGLDRYAPGSIGGLDICEYITYDRILTDRERIDTEAYLMKKWLGQEHPLKATPALAKVAFAEGKKATLVAESDAKVTAVDAPQGDLEKTGEGCLAAGVNPAQLTGELKVEAGALALSDGLLAATLKKAYFHVDASQAGTIVTNEAGQVTQWNDVRGASVFYADNWSDWPNAKPTIAKGDCNGMDTVDFGTYTFANGDGIGWSKQEAKEACSNVTTGTGLKWKTAVQTVEGYQIFKLNAGGIGGSSHAPVVGATGTCNFHPDGIYIFNRSGANAHYDLKYNSLVLIDDVALNPMGGDEAKWATYNPTERYLMCGFAVTNKTQATYPYGGAFAYERHQSAGGMRLAEGVYFNQALTEDERAEVIAYLRHKWQVGIAGNVIAPASVKVAKGASLSVNGLALAANDLTFEIDADGVSNPLSVEDALTLADGATIALTAADGFALPKGTDILRCDLVTAGSITYGGDVVLDVAPAIARRYGVTLVKKDNAISVVLQRLGAMIILR